MKLTKQISPLWVIIVFIFGLGAPYVFLRGGGDPQSNGHTAAIVLFIILAAAAFGLALNAKLSRLPNENYNKAALKLWRVIGVILAIIVSIMQLRNHR